MSVWRSKRLMGFGRASSYGCGSAMLQHFVVSGDLLGNGLGLRVVEELLHATGVAGVERVYLIAIHCSAFNRQLGFCDASPQQLLLLKR